MKTRPEGDLFAITRGTRSFRSNEGVTILEIVITMAVLVIAVLGTLGSISSFAVLGDSSRETNLAYLEAQRMLERMEAEGFRELFIRYNDDPNDDPNGFDTAPGSGFAVEGLAPRVGDADGVCGRILFPVDPATPGLLLEQFVDPDFGMPRDLDSDGGQDLVNKATTYSLLPVRVRVEWRGQSGNRFIELQTLMR